MDWKKIGSGVLLIGGIVLALNGFRLKQGQVHRIGGQVLSETNSLTAEERILALEKRVTALERKLRTTSSASSTVKSISYLRLLDGTATGGSWTAILGSEFWLDQTLYGTYTEIAWEGWLSIRDGNGIAYARLYDITNNRAVDMSEMSISGRERASFFSKVLAIWRGQNQYRIEVKSSTGYPVTISEARLKISVK